MQKKHKFGSPFFHKRNRTIVKKYREGIPLYKLAKEYGLSSERIRQIVGRADWFELNHGEKEWISTK